MASPSPETLEPVSPWWEHPGLQVRDGRLHVAGRDVEQLAREIGTPLWVFDLERTREAYTSLRDALEGTSKPYRIRFALKANREPEVLDVLRDIGEVGIDVCSPGEMAHALNHGWAPEEISFTGTNVSDRDFESLTAHSIHINLDLITQIDRLGRSYPGRTIGIRVNPRAGAGLGKTESVYSGAGPGKFGIYEERLDEAVETARRHSLTIDTIHFHVGESFLTPDLPNLDKAFESVSRMTRTLLEMGCPITEVNAGGGFGVPERPGESRLDLDAYARLFTRHFGDLPVIIACEPGDFLVKESGVALAEVVTVEDRGGHLFAGLDMGWNVLNDPFIYRSQMEIVPCRDPQSPPTGRLTFSGHINEGGDLFAVDYPFPEVKEGDIVAFPAVGGYNQAMTSAHCLRPPAAAVYFNDRV